MIQGGDPNGDGTGGPGYTTVDPPPADAKYTKGVVAMAKTQNEPPGTAGSQFFVVTGADIGLPPDYALLGNVSSGMDVVDKIGKLGDPDDPNGAPTKRVADREGDDLRELGGCAVTGSSRANLLYGASPGACAAREPRVPPRRRSIQSIATPSGPGSARTASRALRGAPSTSPASPSAARCFATACRVTGSSAASSVAVAVSRSASASST